MSVDTDAVRAYGRASDAHAAALHSAAAHLTAAANAGGGYGPVGARFLAALARAAGDDAGALTALGASLAAARAAAGASAQSYDTADAAAALRIMS
ncbi:MAG: ESX-1 secretion-associated protein [Actinomycetota bacterium]